MRNSAAFIAILALAAAARLFFLSFADVATPDEAYNIRMGQDFSQGKPFEVYGSDHRRQPIPVLLFALATVLGDDDVYACRAASLVIAVLTLLVFWHCARFLGSPREALTACVILALVPFSIQYSLLAVNHAAFNLCMLAFLACLLKAQEGEGRAAWVVFAGISAWAAYMSRAEGLIFAFAASLAMIFLPQSIAWRRRVAAAGLFLAVVCLLSLPFWLYLLRETGHWQIAFVSREPGAWHSDWEKAGSLTAHAAVFARSLSVLDKDLPRVLPLFLWVVIAFGAARAVSARRGNLKSLLWFIFFVLLPVVFYSFVTLETRRLQPALIVLLLFSGAGMQRFCEWTASFVRGKIMRQAAAALCWAALLLSFAPGYVALARSFGEEPLEQKRLGEWMKAHWAEPKTVFGSDVRSSFYAGYACKKFIPIAGAEAALNDGKTFEQFLKDRRIDFVVADSRYLSQYYPALRFLLGSSPSAALRPVYSLKEDGQSVVLMEVLKERLPR